MKRLFIMITILFTLCLVGCDDDIILSNKYVRDYITDSTNYEEVYIKDINCSEKHLLNSDDSAEIKDYLKHVYNSKAKLEPKNNSDLSSTNKKQSDFTLLTTPSLAPTKGVFNLFLEDSNGDNYIKFIYICNDEEYSLRIFDSSNDNACSVIDNNTINDFGHRVESYLRKYCYVYMKLTDIYPLFKEINSDNVSLIEVVSEYSGMDRMSLKEHFYYEDPNTLNDFINLYLTATASEVDYYDIMVPGGSSTIMTIYMKDGQKHDLYFYQGCLEKDHKYYSLCMNEQYIEHNSSSYSFYADNVTGELYNKEYKFGEYTLDLSKIRFVVNETELDFEKEYEFVTSSGIFYFMDEYYFMFNDVVYLVVEGMEEIAILLEEEKQKEIQYIETPYVITDEMMNYLVYTGLDTGLNKTRVESLNNYQSINGETLATIFGLDSSLTDEKIRNEYMFLIIKRNCPIHDDFKKVEYSDLFIESKNLYVSIKYSCKKEGVYDAAVTTYTDILLVPKSFGESLTSNFEVTFNSWYQDGKNIMLLCSDIYDIKESYKKSSYYPNVGEYEITILKAYGRFNEATVLLMSNTGIDFLEVETTEVVAGYEFIYPNSNTMLVYHYNNIYTLTEAYNKNILKSSDIALIYQNYEKSK